MRVRGVAGRIRGYVSKLAFWTHSDDRAFSARSYSKKPMRLTESQHAELEVLCTKLFEKRDLVASGRLQILGLRAVKAQMGRRWTGMQDQVFVICEETISKYLERGDIYIRYEDDSYILLFMSSTLVESDMKAALMAEEIRRRLFDELGLDSITMEKEMSHISAHEVDRNLPFIQSVPLAFDKGRMRATMEMAEQGHKTPDFTPIPRTEVEFVHHRHHPRRFGRLKHAPKPDPVIMPFSGVRFMPAWDQYRGRRVSLVAVADYPGAGPNAMQSHRNFYIGRSDHEIVEMDMFILQAIINWLRSNSNALPEFGLICPVNFRTLSSREGKERYRSLCQQIDDRMKQFMLFLVMDLPVHMPWLSMEHLVSPLKTYSRFLCGQVPLDITDTDIEALRMAGFDVLGVFVGDSAAGRTHKSLQPDLENFVHRARKHIINRTFIMGADDADTAVAAAMADVRFMAGDAIHPCVPKPESEQDFSINEFFRLWRSDPARSGGVH
ncbi:hypothetical protein [Micavibrio aeruginosavorus]|uniref:Uncharacterized protein n=1 Tax=Micavibrio aeruginosavorus EPB TaxID=349215 RepID=M4VFH9_9BACT|nr:hypothetical protein [Micavibrio aeruginosavorus]AGH98117.1 hypothetical protein A11S_1305 [Micavibrio aeruginosavorus EPB]